MAHSEEQLRKIQDTLREAQEFARPGLYYHYDEVHPENPERPYMVLQGPTVNKRTLLLGNVHYTAEYPPYSEHVDPAIVWERPLFSAPDTPESQMDGFADPMQMIGGVLLRRFNFYKPLDGPLAE